MNVGHSLSLESSFAKEAESFSTLHSSPPSALENTARVKTGSSSSCVMDNKLALEGFMREDATLISMDGRAFGGSKRSGYSSVMKPLYILVLSVGLS